VDEGTVPIRPSALGEGGGEMGPQPGELCRRPSKMCASSSMRPVFQPGADRCGAVLGGGVGFASKRGGHRKKAIYEENMVLRSNPSVYKQNTENIWAEKQKLGNWKALGKRLVIYGA